MSRPLSGMALLSAATLLLQVTLTRILSIAQFYHFAFLVISLALLGFGASGTLLTLAPRLRKHTLTPWYAIGFSVTLIMAYLLINHLPFDSYSLTTDPLQILLLILNLLGLAIPFLFAGALIGTLLSLEAAQAGRIYGANMAGSALGAILAPVMINWMGSERTLLTTALLGCLASWLLLEKRRKLWIWPATLSTGVLLLLITAPALFAVQPSPYKTLSHFHLNPNARVITTRESAASRLDMIESSTIHSAQGLSLGYLGQLPPQMGLVLDGNTLLAVADFAQAAPDLAASMPAAVAYAVRPDAAVLLLGSGGNMAPWVALENGAAAVTVVEPDRLVAEMLTSDGMLAWGGIYDNPRVRLIQQEIRTFVQQTTASFDVVELTLTDNYRPITTGAFSLSENYTLTVEAVQHYLNKTGDNGLFVVTRWLQTPPSESLRMLSLILTALDSETPLDHMIVFRSFQTATFIVKPTPFAPGEVEVLLRQIDALDYDLVLAPDMPAHLINQHARLPSPIYHDTFLALATAPERQTFYTTYQFDVSPPTDNRPFFYNFFRWEQTAAILAELGRRWQPFGGSGYFVLVVLLGFASVTTALLILLPIALRRRFRRVLVETSRATSGRILLYFAVLGLAFMMVEIALVQQFILVLGQPTLAMATVIGTLLFFSGVGSAASARISWRGAIVVLALLLIAGPITIKAVAPLLLSLSAVLRYMVVILMIAPVGVLMGVPFPRGIAALSQRSEFVPWAWTANGSVSVISSVLAAMLAMGLGLSWVLMLGGGLYLLAALLVTNPDPVSVAQNAHLAGAPSAHPPLHG